MDALLKLNALPKDQFLAEMERCCGARLWGERMAAARPIRNREELFKLAERAWFDLGPDDWKEAFRHPPKNGDKHALRANFAATRQLAAGDQQGAAVASEAVLDALAAGNQAYDEKCGHIFIVCATGKSAEEMLSNLNARLGNSAALELRIAAGEQSKITRLRLEKLLAG